MAVRILRRALAAGALLATALLLWQILTMTPATRAVWAVAWANARQGHIGVGTWDGTTRHLDYSRLQPGDIILSHNLGSSWGYWTHAALYLGDGQVMEDFLRFGIHPEPVTRYDDYYSDVVVLRVKAPADVRQRAVDALKAAQGRPFYFLAPRRSDYWFYCIKTTWWAYKQAGIDLDPGGAFWVVPDHYVQSPYVEMMRID